MLGLFFLVAIFNLTLGYALGRRLPQRFAVRWIICFAERHRQDFRSDAEERESTTVIAESAPIQSPAPSKPLGEKTNSIPTHPTESPPSAALNDANATQSSNDWDGLSSSLTNVVDQLTYVRSIADKSLAQQVATKFEQLVESWYNELTEQIEGNEEDSNIDDEEMMLLEQFLAQLETTLTNLKLLDWSEEIGEITARLEKEVRILDESRPQLATTSP